jgi:hypothetical protein
MIYVSYRVLLYPGWGWFEKRFRLVFSLMGLTLAYIIVTSVLASSH